MSDEELEQVQRLLSEGLTQEQVAKRMGFKTYHTFRVRMLEAGKTIQPCVVDIAEQRRLRQEAADKTTALEPVPA